MSNVFISHVEEDIEIALEVALGLEETGYTTWCYEVDSIPGPSYLIQTGQAVERAKAIVVVISPHSLGSRQVTKEIVRAHESGKEFIPVLRGITHVEFQNRQPEWREAIGAAASITIPKEGVASILPRIIGGLKALEILPRSKIDSTRIAQIRKTLDELKGPQAVEKTGELPITATRPEIEHVTAEIRTAVTTEKAGWYKKWGRLALIAFAVIAASILGVFLLTQPEPTSPPNEVTSTLSTPVNFPDSNLYSTIKEALHKTTGPIYASDLQSLTTLSAQGRNISDLTGLEHCVNLQRLNIYENNISDVTPLAQLTSLRELYIYKNSISDISPLAGLVGLEELWLGRNNISDISPLRGLTNLNVLVLIYNNVTDVSPLVENKGLSNGDTVNLTGNPLSTTSVNVHIPQLEERGVTVLLEPTSSGLIYEDDFSNPGSGWANISQEDRELSYEDGEYCILVKKFNWAVCVWNRNAGLFTDSTLEIDARLVSGPEEACYGVIFRCQRTETENYYRFLVSGDGCYLIGTKTKDKWTVLQDWKESTFINQGNNTNHLKVVCQDSQIEAYVNGHHLATVTDDSFAEGYVGMIVDTPEPDTRVAFDNIEVYSLD